MGKLEAQKKNSRQWPDSDPHSDIWLDYRDAAEMMRCPKDYFRIRDCLGDHKHWPQIERWQPGGRRTRLYVRREHVAAWIERSRTPPCPVNMEMKGIGYKSLVPDLIRMGAYRTMKSLGLEQYIPAAAIKKTVKKKGSAN